MLESKEENVLYSLIPPSKWHTKKVSAVNKFLFLVEETKSNEIRQLSPSFPAKIAQKSEFRDLLHSDRIEENLHHHLNYDSHSVQAAAVKVITEMAAGHSSKESFLNLSTIFLLRSCSFE
ncbi:uncharacterized protein LOC143247499 [Tachypleus tridentatus]|uniref:uncharacterized protein LOC143247499 n=1 Tax=Tachypleus tridentatus TaxID=6853 RepID=UPI003FD16436